MQMSVTLGVFVRSIVHVRPVTVAVAGAEVAFCPPADTPVAVAILVVVAERVVDLVNVWLAPAARAKPGPPSISPSKSSEILTVRAAVPVFVTT